MALSNAVSGLDHFKRLSGSVYIHEPTHTSSSSNEPDLILICGWMDAKPKHLSKYTAGYEKLYPSARILAITTTSIDAAFTTWAANFRRVQPVLEILYALHPNSKLLLHSFSDGGSFTSTLIAKRYQEKLGKMLPTTAVVLDSSPGKASREATIRAFSVALPKSPLVRVIATWGFRVFFWLYRIAYILRALVEQKKSMNMVERSRVAWNTPSLMDDNTPRLYIYSVSDRMVEWHFVEEHAEEAEKLGYVVDKEKFLDSAHCGHLMVDPKRYWAAVQRLWNRV